MMAGMAMGTATADVAAAAAALDPPTEIGGAQARGLLWVEVSQY